MPVSGGLQSSISLRLKIIVPLMLLGGLATLFNFYHLQSKLNQQLYEVMSQRGRDMADSFVTMAQVVGQSAVLSRQVNYLGAEPTVRLVAVYDETNRTIIAANRNAWLHEHVARVADLPHAMINEMSRQRKTTTRWLDGQLHYEVVAPLLLGGDDGSLRHGGVYIRLDASHLIHQLENEMRNSLWLQIALLFVLALLIYLSLFAIVLKPLQLINQYVSTREEKGQAMFPLLHYDEIGQLGESLRTTLNVLQQREDIIQEKARELEEVNQSLEYRVQERTQELKSSNDKLQELLEELKKTQQGLIESEKMAALGNLVAGVAHEINTPVGISLTGVSHINDELVRINNKFEADELEEEDFRHFIATSQELVQASLASLRRAAEQIKSFKQVAADQTSLDKRLFRVKEYVEEVVLSLRNQLKKTKHQIFLDIDDSLQIRSFPGAFSQIITNLITNSLVHAFTPEESGEMHISCMVDGQNFVLIYEDDGCGIPLEHRDKIFEPFFTTRRNRGGTGLGLNIVYNIAKKQLKGDLHIEHLQPGTRFIIEMPLDHS